MADNDHRQGTSMSLEQEILNTLRGLPLDKQQEVLDHVKSLRREVGKPSPPRKSGRGLWADLNVDLSAEEIDEAREEMWRNFPRDDF
jgi:hypothetical protein